jgi:hypothetical protein
MARAPWAATPLITHSLTLQRHMLGMEVCAALQTLGALGRTALSYLAYDDSLGLQPGASSLGNMAPGENRMSD